jgi:hypothetical protein
MTTKKNQTSWKPKQSGNAKGRPRNAVAAAAKLRDKIGDDIDEVLNNVIEQAKAGDLAACRLLIDRVLPAIKAIESPVELVMPQGAGLVAKGEAVLDAVSIGQIAPSQAAQILGGLGALAKLVETQELMTRIDALESQAKGAGK